MARVKRSVHGRKHHRAVLEQAQGYYGNKSRTYRAANEQLMHSMQYAYRDRRARKGDFRKLWIQRINAAARLHGMSYSRFIAGLHQAGVEVDRKVLADLAVTDAEAFAALVDVAAGAWPGPGRGPRPPPERSATRTSGSGGCAACSPSAPPAGPSGPSWSRASSSCARPWRPARCPRRVYLAAEGGRRRQAGGALAEADGAAAGCSSWPPGWCEKVADTVTPQPVLAVFADGRPGAGRRWPGGPGGGAGRRARPGERRHRAAHGRRRRGRRGGLLRRHRRPLQPEDRPLVGRLALPRAAGRRRPTPARRWRLWPAGATAGWARWPGAARTTPPSTGGPPIALVLGNEAAGLAAGLPARRRRWRIPMAGRAESLNVGMACAVLCFEALRQRRTEGAGARCPQCSDDALS